jgi:putative membrane protein
MLEASIERNDRKAYWLIGIFSVVVFVIVTILGKVEYKANLGFDVHIFAKLNVVINSMVSVLLVAAFVAVKNNRYVVHKRLMLTALILSVFFLLFYIAHHLFAGETKFGGTGTIRLIYFIVLATHIILAGMILPFILFTAYRALTGEYEKHKKLARYTWPLWLYVAVTGPIVYFFISPYYT